MGNLSTKIREIRGQTRENGNLSTENAKSVDGGAARRPAIRNYSLNLALNASQL